MKAFSMHGGQDKWVRKFNHNGDFSVKLAYQVLLTENSLANDHTFAPKVWNRLWSFKLPFKLIIFMWKLCNDYLPTKVKFHKRIGSIFPLCPIYLHLEHLFLLCPLARAVWFRIDLLVKTNAFYTSSLIDWIQEWLF